MVQLSRKHLKAELQGTAPDNIIYSIMPLNGQPQHGNTSLAITMLITCFISRLYIQTYIDNTCIIIWGCIWMQEARVMKMVINRAPGSCYMSR